MLFFELTEEIGLIVESGLVKNLVDRKGGIGEQLRSLFDPDVTDEFRWGHATDGFELPVELHLAHS